MVSVGTASPLQAQLRTEDVINLGIQLLLENERSRGQAAPKAGRATTPSAQTRSARSQVVADAQRALNDLGYDAGSVDGVAGPQTRRAVAAFQRDHGLASTGQVNPEVTGALLDRLAVGGALQIGQDSRPTALPGVAPSESISLLRGFDLPGGDYRSGLSDPRLQGVGIDACAEYCSVDDQCRGFTYNTSADICILKDALGGMNAFAAAVSGVKAGATLPVPNEEATIAGALPSYRDFVHMALMSDTEAYLAEPGPTGIAYISATGTEAQCRMLYNAKQQDEFARREALAEAAALLEQVVASLPNRPRRVEWPIQEVYTLDEYDFDRQGFPISVTGQPRVPILAPGVVALRTEDPPPFCTASLGFSDYGGAFDAVGAEHGGVPGVDFLPMGQDQARAFRAQGRTVLLKATLVVEPRDQGRGPLKGHILAVSAHDPMDDRLLYAWDAPMEVAAEPSDVPALSSDLLAAIVVPVLVPQTEQSALDTAAVQYFRLHERAISAGNEPPQSPLPINEMRGRAAEVIAATNRDRLRQTLLQDPQPLPVTITIAQPTSVYYDEAKGLHFNTYETGLAVEGSADPLAEVQLSDRDLQIYDNLIPFANWQDTARAGFRQSFLGSLRPRVRVEFDRVLRLDAVPLSIEEAAARGLVGYTGAGQRDQVVLDWTLDLTEVRATKGEVILSATLRSLSYRWQSDGVRLASFPADHFPTVAGLRGAAEASLPPLAEADSVATPPDGTRWGAEMTDLMQLRFAPETVDDRVMERMLMTRFAYEARMGQDEPLWGRFFRDVSTAPTPEERMARLGEFRDWSEARARALPARLTLLLPLDDTAEGKRAPYENRGRPAHFGECRSAPTPDQPGLAEAELAQAKVCAVLDAAWQAPEPLFAPDLRHDCTSDVYCDAMYASRTALGLPHVRGSDLVRLEQLPVLDAATRAGKGRLAIEIEVELTGAVQVAEFPATLMDEARLKARTFGLAYGLERRNGLVGLGEERAPQAPLTVFEANATSARLVDLETGAVVGTLALAAPAALPLDLLTMPESKVAGRDLLGIRLGMSFDEADRLIREHMEVTQLLLADRSTQTSAATGQIVPYTSGRIYASAKGDELIAIYDEPPVAAGKVLGIWRVLRLPKGSIDPAGLRKILSDRYGEPSLVEEVALPMMQTGVGYQWLDIAHPRCASIDVVFQTDLWRDETGATTWLPPFMNQPLFPVPGSQTMFLDAMDQPLQPSSFCPAFLGARYASYDGRSQQSPAGDEIITWLTDNRSYMELFYQSRLAPPPAPEGDSAEAVEIEF